MEILLEKYGLKHEDYDESRIFFNEEMLKDNVIIYEDTFIDNDDVETYISVKHYNELDACEYHLYWGDLLSPIQTFRIVVDIYEIYKNFSLNEFLQIVDEISTGGISSSMQTHKKSKDDIMNRIKEEIDSLK